jgi:hypothetical protein
MKMGFEGLIYRGTAGVTAATLLENVADITLDLDMDDGDTTVRGDSTAVPIETASPTVLKWSCKFTMLNNNSDANVEALKVAANAGTPIALRLKDYAAGKGYDGDVTLKYSHGKPLKGQQTVEFTAKPSRAQRVPQLYV